MAALSITAASVVPSVDAVIVQITANDTITAGQIVYLDANGKAVLCTANGSGLTFKAYGMAADGASAGQPVNIITQDKTGTALGSILTTGTVYIAGATAGAVNPVADNTSGWKVSPIGVALSATVLKIFPIGQCRADVAT